MVLQVFLCSCESPESTEWEQNDRWFGRHCTSLPNPPSHTSSLVVLASGINMCLFIKQIPFLLLILQLCLHLCFLLCLSPSTSLSCPVFSLPGLCSPESLPSIVRSFASLFSVLLSSRLTHANLSPRSQKCTISRSNTESIFRSKFLRTLLSSIQEAHSMDVRCFPVPVHTC